MFELYKKPNGPGVRGSISEVWIDKDTKLVKKIYKPSGITISGHPPLVSDLGKIQRLYENETYWSTRLQSDMVVKTLDHGPLSDEPGWFIMQEWHGPDLLTRYDVENRLSLSVPDAKEQVIEMFKFLQANDVYKINNAMSNMTLCNGRILMFDFKWAVKRCEHERQRELRSINEWISKIDPSLKESLLPFI